MVYNKQIGWLILREIKKWKKTLRLELADVIFSIIYIANYYKVDLEKAFSKVIEKYTERDIGRWTPKSK